MELFCGHIFIKKEVFSSHKWNLSKKTIFAVNLEKILARCAQKCKKKQISNWFQTKLKLLSKPGSPIFGTLQISPLIVDGPFQLAVTPADMDVKSWDLI